MSWQNLTQEQLEVLPTPRLLNVYKTARAHLFANSHEYDGDDDEYNALQQKVIQIHKMLRTREHLFTEDVKITHKTRDPKLKNLGFSKSAIRRQGTRDLAWSEQASVLSGEKVMTKDGKIRPTFGPITDLESAIGEQVKKLSGKPFKSKNKYNTVKGVTINPHTERHAFTFEDDDSIVDAHICTLRGK